MNNRHRRAKRLMTDNEIRMYISKRFGVTAKEFANTITAIWNPTPVENNAYAFRKKRSK